jgi:predicted nucleic acid-binding protein
MKIKKIYINLCVYNRPFDNQREPRIQLETNIFLILLEQIENKKYIVVNSDVLEYENQNNPYHDRKEKINDYLSIAAEKIRLTDKIIQRAKLLENLNFSSLDALHIACAEEANADYYITCDDKLLKKAKFHEKKLKIRVTGLIEFLNREVGKQWQK